MKRTSSMTLVLIALSSMTCLAFAQDKQAVTVRESMIVSTEWLAKHLNDKSLVLLQVGEKDEYITGHIPRAQFITLADISTPRGEGMTLELPPAIQLKAVFEKLGVSDDSRIVIYFSKDWVSPTTRVFFTLDYLGLGDQTSILDGGLPAWRVEGRPITGELTTPTIGKIDLRTRPDRVVDSNWVSKNLSSTNVRILDARAPQFYSGAEAGRMPRAGRIPSARNIPFSTLVEDGSNKFKSAAVLKKLFDDAEVNAKSEVATYCHIGQQASLLYFAARYLGYDVRLYDGSFEDWSRSDKPVEKDQK